MQNRIRDTDVHNSLLDSVGEGEGGMFWENSIDTVYSQGWKRSIKLRAWLWKDKIDNPLVRLIRTQTQDPNK